MKQPASRLEQHSRVISTNNRRAGFPFASRRLHEHAVSSIMSAPVEPQPLLALQRLAFQTTSAICVCDGFRSAQRYYFEFSREQGIRGEKAFLVHEMMPVHQQDYILDCLHKLRKGISSVPISLFTTQHYYHILIARLPWIVTMSETITTVPPAFAISNTSSGDNSDVTVSCICLCSGTGGRWLLMDHEEAATVQADFAPSAKLVPRLLRHAVNISGDRLAPYLAMMFDVPNSWKSHPELATRSLLIFDNGVCDLGCRHRGMPSHITWSDLLGIVY